MIVSLTKNVCVVVVTLTKNMCVVIVMLTKNMPGCVLQIPDKMAPSLPTEKSSSRDPEPRVPPRKRQAEPPSQQPAAKKPALAPPPEPSFQQLVAMAEEKQAAREQKRAEHVEKIRGARMASMQVLHSKGLTPRGALGKATALQVSRGQAGSPRPRVRVHPAGEHWRLPSVPRSQNNSSAKREVPKPQHTPSAPRPLEILCKPYTGVVGTGKAETVEKPGKTSSSTPRSQCHDKRYKQYTVGVGQKAKKESEKSQQTPSSPPRPKQERHNPKTVAEVGQKPKQKAEKSETSSPRHKAEKTETSSPKMIIR